MKIKIVTPDNSHAQAWAAALSAVGGSLKVGTVVQPLHTVNVLVNGSRPDLVVAEALEARDFEALEALAGAHPEIDYVLVGGELTPEMLMRAMRAGVREVLPSPASAEAVLAAVQRQLRKRPAATAAAATPEQRGEVLAFVSCKGGSGATFTAANLAHVLAAGGARKVALIDMNLQFGDALLFLNSEQPGSNVADVARNIGRLDRDLLLAAMVAVSPGLHVLAAPDDPAQASDVAPAHVQAIVQLARTIFDIVVIDSGRSLSAVTLETLDMADQVYAVLQLTLPFIRDGKRLRDVFRSLDYPTRKIHWVVNRYEKNSEITLDDLKKTLGITELITLPNQYDVVATSVNQGVPVATVAPNSAIAKALRDWGQRIAPAPDKPRSRWLSGLFRGSAAGGGD
jgi:pilus assembly protein CpaE